MDIKAVTNRVDLDRALGDLSAPDRAARRLASDQLSVALAEGDSELIAALGSLLVSDETGTRFAAAYTLARSARLTAAAIRILLEALGADSDSRWAIAQVVPAAIPSLYLSSLLVVGTTRQRRMVAYCFDAIENLGEHDLAGLAKLICHDPDPRVRTAVAATLLRRFSQLEAIPDAQSDLLALLDDPDAGVRRAVAARLSSVATGSEMVRSALQRIVDTSADDSLRRAANHALRKARVDP